MFKFTDSKFLSGVIVGNDPYQIGVSRKLQMFENWGPSFFISVDVYINSWITDHERVLFVFNDGSGLCCEAGQRVPFVGTSSSNTLTFRAPIGTNTNYKWEINGIPTQQWFNLIITQYENQVNIFN